MQRMQTACMIQSLHLVRCDPTRNLARFYRLELDRTLFGEVVLVRRWGRIGTFGQSRQTVLTDIAAGEAAMAKCCAAKRRRGYRAG